MSIVSNLIENNKRIDVERIEEIKNVKESIESYMKSYILKLLENNGGMSNGYQTKISGSVTYYNDEYSTCRVNELDLPVLKRESDEKGLGEIVKFYYNSYDEGFKEKVANKFKYAIKKTFKGEIKCNLKFEYYYIESGCFGLQCELKLFN